VPESRQWIADICAHESERQFLVEACQIGHSPCLQIIDDDDRGAFIEKPCREIGTDKAGTAGDENGFADHRGDP
jgi:hypothetical protein